MDLFGVKVKRKRKVKKKPGPRSKTVHEDAASDDDEFDYNGQFVSYQLDTDDEEKQDYFTVNNVAVPELENLVKEEQVPMVISDGGKTSLSSVNHSEPAAKAIKVITLEEYRFKKPKEKMEAKKEQEAKKCDSKINGKEEVSSRPKAADEAIPISPILLRPEILKPSVIESTPPEKLTVVTECPVEEVSKPEPVITKTSENVVAMDQGTSNSDESDHNDSDDFLFGATINTSAMDVQDDVEWDIPDVSVAKIIKPDQVEPVTVSRPTETILKESPPEDRTRKDSGSNSTRKEITKLERTITEALSDLIDATLPSRNVTGDSIKEDVKAEEPSVPIDFNKATELEKVISAATQNHDVTEPTEDLLGAGVNKIESPESPSLPAEEIVIDLKPIYKRHVREVTFENYSSSGLTRAQSFKLLKPFQEHCRTCLQLFQDKAKFIEHVTTATGHIKYNFEGKVECQVCKQYVEKLLLPRHMIQKHFPTHRCNICGEKFVNQEKMDSHFNEHGSILNGLRRRSNEINYECDFDFCPSKWFKTMDDAVSHVKNVHFADNHHIDVTMNTQVQVFSLHDLAIDPLLMDDADAGEKRTKSPTKRKSTSGIPGINEGDVRDLSPVKIAPIKIPLVLPPESIGPGLTEVEQIREKAKELIRNDPNYSDDTASDITDRCRDEDFDVEIIPAPPKPPPPVVDLDLEPDVVPLIQPPTYPNKLDNESVAEYQRLPKNPSWIRRDFLDQLAKKFVEQGKERFKHSLIPRPPMFCTDCGQLFQAMSRWKIHNPCYLRYYPNYSCPMENCTVKYLRTIELLHEHYQQYHCEPQYHCNKCPSLFRSEMEAFHHRCTGLRNIFLCTFNRCFQEFRAGYEVTAHLMMSHLDNVHWKEHCTLCNLFFPDQAARILHDQLVHGVNPDNPRHVTINEINNNMADDPVSVILVDHRKPFQCRLCLKQFKTVPAWENHVRAVHHRRAEVFETNV